MVVWAGLIILLSATNQAQIIYPGGGGLSGSREMTSTTPTIPYPGTEHRDWDFSTVLTDYDYQGTPVFDCDVGLSDHHDKPEFHQKTSEALNVDDQIRQLKQTLRKKIGRAHV